MNLSSWLEQRRRRRSLQQVEPLDVPLRAGTTLIDVLGYDMMTWVRSASYLDIECPACGAAAGILCDSGLSDGFEESLGCHLGRYVDCRIERTLQAARKYYDRLLAEPR